MKMQKSYENAMNMNHMKMQRSIIFVRKILNINILKI